MISDILKAKSKEEIYYWVTIAEPNCSFFKGLKRDRPNFFESAVEAFMKLPNLDIINSAESFLSTGRSMFFIDEDKLNAAEYLWKLAGLPEMNYTTETARVAGILGNGPAATDSLNTIDVYYFQRFDP
jgi:hypothetical protein